MESNCLPYQIWYVADLKIKSHFHKTVDACRTKHSKSADEVVNKPVTLCTGKQTCMVDTEDVISDIQYLSFHRDIEKKLKAKNNFICEAQR